jgi:excisionase family DNA binding protein
MQTTYDPTVDALAIQFRDGAKRPATKEVAPGLFLDFDREGRLVALELLDASRHIARAELDQLPTGGRLLTLAEAAQLAKREKATLSPVTLRVQIRNGRIPATKRGRDWLIHETDLINYLESRERTGRPSSRSADVDVSERKPARRGR